MKKMFLALSLTAVGLLMISCTEQNRAKNYGGTIKVDLPPGQKLEIATWKDSNLWYLIRPMRSGEKQETHEFVENSSYGVLEGKIIFQEH